MTVKDATRGTADLKALVASDPDFIRALMRTALQAMAADERLDLSVLVTGMHLSDEFGGTWREVEAAGLPIAARVPVDVTTRSRASMATSLGEAVIGMTQLLAQTELDVREAVDRAANSLADAQARSVALERAALRLLDAAASLRAEGDAITLPKVLLKTAS